MGFDQDVSSIVRDKLKELDVDGTGLVCAEQFIDVLNELNFEKADICRVLEEQRLSKGGKVDYSKFVDWTFGSTACEVTQMAIGENVQKNLLVVEGERAVTDNGCTSSTVKEVGNGEGQKIAESSTCEVTHLAKEVRKDDHRLTDVDNLAVTDTLEEAGKETAREHYQAVGHVGDNCESTTKIESSAKDAYLKIMCRRCRNIFDSEKCCKCGLERSKHIIAEGAKTVVVEKGHEEVFVELSLRSELTEGMDDNYVLASIKTPSCEKIIRHASDLVCILDVSGSMGMEAAIQSSVGATESHGLSLLDVAKHGIRTIIKTLGASDRLAIVSFSNLARVVLPLTTMDEEGQAKAELELDSLRAMGGTNIWEGLKSALDELCNHPTNGSFGHIMLLTDGESTDRDGIMPKLIQYKGARERLPGTINTFGFGYRLDSALLVELAVAGSGSYSFIPDAGFVGTVFVNTMSNLLVTMAREVYLTLALDDVEITDNQILGGYPVEAVSGCTRVNLGTLQYGQTKDVVVRMRGVDIRSLVASVQYETSQGCKEESPCTEIDIQSIQPDEVEMQRCRCAFADCLAKAIEIAHDSCEKASEILATTMLDVGSSTVRDRGIIQKLLEDIGGQATEALSKQEWFQKWGRHYLPSVMFAHRLQQCNNFKDPGVQVYGGGLFTLIQEMADDLFNELPPPKPSIRRVEVSAPTSMAAFNDRYAG